MRTLVLAVMLALVTAVAAHPWQCYHGDPQHTGKSVYTVGDSLQVAWTYGAGGDISGSPVVTSSGKVIFGARDVRLYCLNPNGTKAWDADLSSLGSNIYFSAPALDGSGNIYMTTNRKLVKIDSSGAILWSRPSHNSLSISHSPVIGKDGKVYFACYSESLYAFTPAGALDWARPVGRDVNSSPAVGHDGRIYVATTRGSDDCKLWAFEPNGNSPWSVDLAGEADFASPAVGPDSVIYVGASRYLYAIRPDGTVKWRDSLSAIIQSCPAVANDSTLYVVAGARFYCVSTDSGVRWRKSIGGSNFSAPAVDARGNIYAGSDANAFFVIGPDSTVLWRYPVPDNIWSSPAIGPNGRVYVGCMNGTLYAFEPAGTGINGERVSQLTNQVQIFPNPTTGRVRFAGCGKEKVKSVRVFNSAGQEQKVPVGRESLDLSELPVGVYLVESGLWLVKVVRR